MSKPSYHAVLTGDIVSSQKLSATALGQLPRLIAEAAQKTGFDSKVEVFSGDSWQAFCAEPEVAMTWALIFRSYLFGEHAIETRVAIGIGTISSLNPAKISLSHGEAFVLSGHALSETPSDRRITIATSPALPSNLAPLLDASCALLDALSSDWTEKQAQAIALASSNLPQNELATTFDPPISAQAFGKRLASAQWKPVKDALKSISDGIKLSLAPSS